jgi:hypothetical protein
MKHFCKVSGIKKGGIHGINLACLEINVINQ